MPEILPLSASPGEIDVEVELAKPSAASVRQIRVPAGTRVRGVLRQIGEPPEGSAVLIDGVSVPLDLPLHAACRLIVVPTFSGG